MEHTLQDRLRALLTATSVTSCETAQEVEDEDEASPNSNLSIVVISRPSSATTHWAIAVVTDERSRRCRVFHVSDVHIVGLCALSPGWTCFAQDETLDSSSSYRGGVRIGLVEKDDLDRLEEVRPLIGGYLAPLNKRSSSSHTKHRTPTRPSAATSSPLPHPTRGTVKTGHSQ